MSGNTESASGAFSAPCAVGRAGCALLALTLAAALGRFVFVSPALPAWQISAIAAGLALGLWQPGYGILAFVFLTPLLGFIPRSHGIKDLSLPEHLLIPLLACAALRLAWRGSPPGAVPRPANAIDRPLALLLGVMALSAVRALGEYHAVGLSLRGIVGPLLGHHFSFTVFDFTNGPFLVVHYTVVALEGAGCFMLLTAADSGVRAASLRAALLLSAGTVALVGVAQAIWHFQMIEFFQRVQPGLIRINATLPDPNTLGSYLVLLLPLGLVVASQRRAGRWLAAGWGGLVLYCLFRCVSRTAWMSLAVVGVVTLAVAGWRPAALGWRISPNTARWLRRALGALLVSAAVVVAVISAGGVGRDRGYEAARSPVDMLVFTLNARRPVDELLPARAEHWRAAVDIWRDFPLLGAGIGKYALLKNRYLPEARSRWMFFTEPHNYYLKILSELGLAGLAAFLVLLGGIGLQAYRVWATAGRHGRQRVAAVAAGIGGFLLCSVAQDPLILREMQYVFWAVVALLVLEPRSAPARDSDSAQRGYVAADCG